MRGEVVRGEVGCLIVVVSHKWGKLELGFEERTWQQGWEEGGGGRGGGGGRRGKGGKGGGGEDFTLRHSSVVATKS